MLFYTPPPPKTSSTRNKGVGGRLNNGTRNVENIEVANRAKSANTMSRSAEPQFHSKLVTFVTTVNGLGQLTTDQDGSRTDQDGSRTDQNERELKTNTNIRTTTHGSVSTPLIGYRLINSPTQHTHQVVYSVNSILTNSVYSTQGRTVLLLVQRATL